METFKFDFKLCIVCIVVSVSLSGVGTEEVESDMDTVDDLSVLSNPLVDREVEVVV